MLVAILVTALAAAPQECEHEAPYSGRFSAEGLRVLMVEAEAGSLRIEGRPGVREVTVSGTACASSRDLLEEVVFRATAEGGRGEVSTDTPDRLRDREYARLDLEIIVPAGMALDIVDGSGEIEILNVGATRIDDGSGELSVRNVQGDLTIEDGSGEIDIQNVSGNVRISDGSGEIEIDEVQGSVDIEDGSGSIDVVGVRLSVEVDDGSGSIRVRDIRGDFRVLDDTSGDIDHTEVRGVVDVPRHRRHR